MKLLLALALLLPNIAQAGKSCYSPLLKKRVSHGEMGKRKCCYNGDWKNDRSLCERKYTPPRWKPTYPDYPNKPSYQYEIIKNNVSNVRTGVSNCNDHAIAEANLKAECRKKYDDVRAYGVNAVSYWLSDVHVSASHSNSIVSGRRCTANSRAMCNIKKKRSRY